MTTSLFFTAQVAGRQFFNSLDLYFRTSTFLFALNPWDGSQKWWSDTGDNSYGMGSFDSVTVSLSEMGIIYVGTTDNCLAAYDVNGNQMWKTSIGGPIVAPASIAADGTIYVGSSDQRVYSLSPDGNINWNIQLGRPVTSASKMSGGLSGVSSSIAIGANGVIYFQVGSMGYALGLPLKSYHSCNDNDVVLGDYSSTAIFLQCVSRCPLGYVNELGICMIKASSDSPTMSPTTGAPVCPPSSSPTGPLISFTLNESPGTLKTRNWMDVTTSSDGKVLVALDSGYHSGDTVVVQISRDGGDTWSPHSPLFGKYADDDMATIDIAKANPMLKSATAVSGSDDMMTLHVTACVYSHSEKVKNQVPPQSPFWTYYGVSESLLKEMSHLKVNKLKKTVNGDISDVTGWDKKSFESTIAPVYMELGQMVGVAGDLATAMGWAQDIFQQKTAYIPKDSYVDIYVTKTIVSHDSGLTWQASNDNFGTCVDTAQGYVSHVVIDFSSNAEIGVAAKTNGYLYYTSNSGDNWYAQFETGIQYWTAVQVTADGSEVYASFSSGGDVGVFVSRDGAISWSTLPYFRDGVFREGFNIGSMAVSPSGESIIIADSGGELHVSSDYGITWSASTLGGRNWTTVTVSHGGGVMGAAAIFDRVYISTNKGLSWDSNEDLLNEAWSSIVVPHDGSFVFGSVYGGHLRVASLTPSTESLREEHSLSAIELPKGFFLIRCIAIVTLALAVLSYRRKHHSMINLGYVEVEDVDVEMLHEPR